MATVIDKSTVVISNKGAGNISEVSQKLLDGKTLFMSLEEVGSVNRATFYSRGMRVRRAAHELDGVKGFAVWAEPRT